jgi:outer membrane protein TolC
MFSLFWLLLSIVFAMPPALASDNDIGESISLELLITQVLERSQELLSAEAQSQRYNARIPLIENLDEQLLAFYYLDFPIGNMSRGTTERENQAPAETPQIVTVKSVRGKVLNGRDMVENQALWYHYLSEDIRLQLIQKAKEGFYRLYFHDRIIAATEQNLATLDHLIRISQSRYAVGTLRQKDVLKAQTERALLQAQLLELEQSRREKVADLNYLAALPASGSIVPMLDTELFPGNLPRPAYETNTMVAGLYRSRPLFKGYQALGARFRAMKMMVQMYFNREVRTEAMFEADSGMRSIKATTADFLNRVAADLEKTYASQEKNLRLAELYENVILPQARQVYQSVLVDFQVGRDDLRSALQALFALNQYQIASYQAQADYMADLSKLEGLSGMVLFGPEIPRDENLDLHNND